MAPAQSHHLLEWFSRLPMYNITYTLPIHTSYTQYQAVLADAVLKTQIWSSSFFNGLIKKKSTNKRSRDNICVVSLWKSFPERRVVSTVGCWLWYGSQDDNQPNVTKSCGPVHASEGCSLSLECPTSENSRPQDPDPHNLDHLTKQTRQFQFQYCKVYHKVL